MRVFLAACAVFLVGCQASQPDEYRQIGPQSGIGKLDNIAYGNDQRQKLDLILPSNAKGEPLLIFIHGGAWVGGDKGTYQFMAKRFTGAGMAVGLINYRLSTDPTIKNPAHVEDAAKAYAWLASHADQYGYDPTKIFVSGHSAGAHNAGMMATGQFLQSEGVASKNLPAGFIGLEGIYDVPALNKKFPSYRDWFLTKAFGETSHWPDGSPTLRPVVLKTPWLIIQSTEDTLVDVAQAEGFDKHLKQAGVPVDLWVKPNGDHDQVMAHLSGPQDGAAKELVRFIEAHSQGWKAKSQ